MILVGSWIPVFSWDSGNDIYTYYMNANSADFNATHRHKMYQCKRNILLNVLNIQIAT